ncbi:out at first protein [Ctenocephalides felis]|uniref:out at first protein n=1 Tax=Ctenocephalides felis TaxID=7515 RepID=UPI000E6E20BF|nr:out at first protein [Ctenocephalides felis]
MYRKSYLIHVVIVTAVFLIYVCEFSNCQLLINVKNQGGDVVQESIFSNISDDAVTLEFQRSDGTLVTQLVDFRNEVQILRALVLGEEERGQSQYQVLCFVTRLHQTDFISADAMSKLRQKNPGTVRTPEEDRGRDNYTLSAWLDPVRAGHRASPHVAVLCGEARDATYAREDDLRYWAERAGEGFPGDDWLPSGARRFPSAYFHAEAPFDNSVAEPATARLPKCADAKAARAPCRCRFEVCVGWYPCGLKYCRGKSAAAGSSYRCGIKTCRKCSAYSYHARQKQHCLWDE